jgi:hypothetical protein
MKPFSNGKRCMNAPTQAKVLRRTGTVPLPVSLVYLSQHVLHGTHPMQTKFYQVR